MNYGNYAHNVNTFDDGPTAYHDDVIILRAST